MSTIRALAFPQPLFSRIKKEFHDHISRPGVYLLIGEDDMASGKPRAYIGESEDVGERLARHLSDSAKTTWWRNTVVFTVKDDNLTKAHIRYVEARLIALVRKKFNWSLGNGNNPPDIGKLPIADRHAMDEFVDQAKTLVATVGHDLFKEDVIKPQQGDLLLESSATVPNQEVFLMSGSGYSARMVYNDSTARYVVLKDSTCRLNEAGAMPEGSRKLRQKLKDEGVLENHADQWVFTEDCDFSSSSSAASVISGQSAAGPTSWRTSSGQTLKTWESVRNAAEQNVKIEVEPPTGEH